MSRTGQLISRFKFEFVGRVAAIVSSGLLMVVLARLLGPDEYGLLFLAVAIFGVLGVFSKLGISNSCARYVAEYKEQDSTQIPHILRVALAFNLVTIVVVCLAVLLGHHKLAGVLDEPALVPFLLVGVLYLAFESLSALARGVLQGYEEIELAAAVHAIGRVTRLVFAVGFVVIGFGALGALVGYILSVVVSSLLGLWFVYRRLYRVLEVAPAIEAGLRRRIGEYTVPLTATSTANVIDKRIDTVLVGFFLTPVAVSYYVVSKQIVEFLETPVSALGFTLSPSFGAQKADGNVNQAARIYEAALTHSLLLYVPAAAGIVLVAEPTIELVFGDDYGGATPVLQVLSMYVVLQSITKLTSNALDFLGRARARAIVKGMTAALNVCLNVLLIPRIGVVGAAIATVVSYSLYTGSNLVIIHQEFGLRIGLLVRRIATIVGVTLTMTILLVPANGHVDGWLSLAAVVSLGVIVWTALSVVTGLIDLNQLRMSV
ncbi:flippase [Halosolutus amylolyticus]|uniref:Flippase n=1 Tax=Halosolutus amylolyticus TaxID=2932267 RepID=A0ABD5PN91_9EURY|nr:flippase [Halosolutus amylolyticus]